ncbi:MAG TPA: hypothetical protein VFA47_12060 [Candidatus Manganitrophaceae bacterium]|nr:hypothetical protein [Candidatus Manganitrophaceae bacterium]
MLKKFLSTFLVLGSIVSAGCGGPGTASVRVGYYGEYPYRRPYSYYYYDPFYDPFFYPGYLYEPYPFFLGGTFIYGYPYYPPFVYPRRRFIRPGDRSLRGFRGGRPGYPVAPPSTPPAPGRDRNPPEDRRLR